MNYKTDGFNKNILKECVRNATWINHDLGRWVFDPFITNKEIILMKEQLQNIIDGLDGLIPTEE